jgi:exopolyphosphatase/guanosine-5'-triphosphate,3'-diphosphate pyrophosphatase
METSGDNRGPRIVAAIDIGSNSIRMLVAQMLPDGRMEVLERMHRAVRLGQDAFLRQRISHRTILAAIGILRDYRRVLDTYQVSQVRAVATSAVREATNADGFLDRILMATSLEVEVIEPAEEGRLTVNAVLHETNTAADLRTGTSLIADVGGGGTLLTLLRNGEISASGSYAVGSVRLQELLATSEEPAERAAELLRHQIASTVSLVKSSLPLAEVAHLICVGGDARFAASLIGKPSPSGLTAMSRKAFDRFVRRASGHTPAELAKIHGLPFADAETLVPALLAYQALWHEVPVEEMLVSQVSMRDGLLLELTYSLKAEETQALRNSVLQSAKGIGEKYRYDANHALHVAELSAKLFEGLRSEHKLSDHELLMLRAAAILHDVGAYVATSSHHKHSAYLIANSELFGLRRTDLSTVAQVARYHRRSPPKRTHQEYMALPREKRMVVSKLAAILRVADALDRGHAQQLREIRLERDPNELIIHVAGVPDLTLERRALVGKADLFEDVYGLKVRLEEADANPIVRDDHAAGV